MKAVRINNGELQLEEVEQPVPAGSELLVRVVSAGLNGADLLQARGLYPPPPGYPPDIPGLEFAGTVVAAGPRATRFHLGAAVMGIVGGAGQAEYVLIEESTAIAVPPELPLKLAGGFPETFFTAYDAMFLQAHLRMGENICIHGGAGGVGVAAIQLALACGAVVTTTVRGLQHHERLTQLGAKVIEPSQFSGSGPYDVILELVGASNLPSNLEEIGVEGRISIIGIGAGAKTEIDLRMLMTRRARLMGSTLRARSTAEKTALATRVAASILPLIQAGKVNVIVHQSFPAAKVQEAYASFAQGGKMGKILLTF